MHITIEPYHDTLFQGFAVYSHDTYPDHSTRDYRDPNASLADLSGLPSEPPGWFDPTDAGERWDEDY